MVVMLCQLSVRWRVEALCETVVLISTMVGVMVAILAVTSTGPSTLVLCVLVSAKDCMLINKLCILPLHFTLVRCCIHVLLVSLESKY